jgi:serine/threonine-protein kinase
VTDEPSSSPYDKTVEFPVPESPARHALRHDVAFVEGSTPQLSAETDLLLKDRLRIASLLMFAGYLAFLLKGLIAREPISGNLGWTVFIDHCAMTLISGFVGWRLCTRCPVMMRHLRLAELLVFGGSTLFFALLTFTLLQETAPSGYLLPFTPFWLLLIFTYALFIPNTWRRSAIVIGSMALTPLLAMITAKLTTPEIARVIETNSDFRMVIEESLMLLALSAVIAVWGVKTIGTLRREAFAAKQLGQYRLKQQIGAGGMGEVYLAEHLLLKRPCAVKLIRPEKAGDPQVLARFEREVQATARLSHWNTVEIFDYGRAEDGTFYYVMEYLPGLNLAQLVELHGALEPERVIHLLMQTCDALSEAHAHELIHRDIKPGNIFAAYRGDVYDVAKLLDFGLVKPIADLQKASLTQDGVITGSPQYMSPEQASGGTPDVRSDIYALGAVAYYLLTGVPPFDGENAIKVIAAHLNQPPIPLTEHNPDIPSDLEQVVLKAMAKDPADRYASAKELRRALSRCEVAGRWSRTMAACWWECHGCPRKKALDAQVLEPALDRLEQHLSGSQA